MKKIIKLLKRHQKRDLPRQRIPVYDLCIVKKSKRSNFVYEKLASLHIKNGLFKFNPYRLAFWLSSGISLSGNSVY